MYFSSLIHPFLKLFLARRIPMFPNFFGLTLGFLIPEKFGVNSCMKPEGLRLTFILQFTCTGVSASQIEGISLLALIFSDTVAKA